MQYDKEELKIIEENYPKYGLAITTKKVNEYRKNNKLEPRMSNAIRNKANQMGFRVEEKVAKNNKRKAVEDFKKLSDLMEKKRLLRKNQIAYKIYKGYDV